MVDLSAKSIERTLFNRSYLPPTSGRDYVPFDALEETNNQSLAGVLLLNSRNSAQFVNVVRAETGIDKAISTLKAKSKEVPSSTKFARAYPDSSLLDHGLSMQGKAVESFDGLQKLVAFAIDPNRIECLTREEGGLFVWSERTIKKLEETRGATETLDQRKVKLVICMLTLLINLLMDTEVNLAEGCFLEPFMGSTFNLLTKSK